MGAGNVLRDIIDSGVITSGKAYTHLPTGTVEPHRDECPCHQPGLLPRHQNGQHTDFFFMKQEEPEKVAETIVSLVRETDCQGLPTADGEHTGAHGPCSAAWVGAANLKHGSATGIELQHGGIVRGGYTYKEGDTCDAAAQQLRQGCI